MKDTSSHAMSAAWREASMRRANTLRPRALAATIASERCCAKHSEMRPLVLPMKPRTPVQQNSPAQTCDTDVKASRHALLYATPSQQDYCQRC